MDTKEMRERAERWIHRIGEPIVCRDSALGEEHLALDVLELLDENARLRSDGAAMKLSRMLGLGDPVRPDIHAAVCRQRDSLRAEVERLRMQHGIACGAAEAMTGAFERSQQQLSAALAAKDEACDLAESLRPSSLSASEWPETERIALLRSIGKDGGNG